MKINSQTIPIDFGSSIVLNSEEARNFGETLSDSYISNAPFPNIVLDNFLPSKLALKILENFPLNNDSLTKLEYAHNIPFVQENKRIIHPENCNEFNRNMFAFFNSAPFLQFLEGLTSISGLMGDSYYVGGGFHEISNGGKLGIHADFELHEKLPIQRRINVLIYLNENWKDEYGGSFEIWDKKMKNKLHDISPIFNRCVIFSTNDSSYHGHPEPLKCPENITRKSIALYYFTASESIYDEVNSFTTTFFVRPNDDFNTKKNIFIKKLQNKIINFLPAFLFKKLINFRNSKKR